MNLTPDQALRFLTDGPSPARDAVRRAWLQAQPDEELLYWLGVCAQTLGGRHGKTEAEVHAGLTKLSMLQDAAEAQAREQARTS